MKIVFWGSSEFSMPALEKLHQKKWVVATVTNPDTSYKRGMYEVHQTPIKVWAEKNGIPCLQPSKLQEVSFLNNLYQFKADLFVVVSYGRILPSAVLTIPPLGCINLHASLLPKYRGPSPIQAAILNGDTQTGNTVQYMSEALDCGDIIVQSLVSIDEKDTYISLSQKLAYDGAELLLDAIQKIQRKIAPRLPQDHSQASYTSLIKREDGLVDFLSFSAQEIERRFRAYQPWPGVFATYHQTKKNLTVHLTSIEIHQINGVPGTILQADKQGLVVACAQHALRLQRVKPAGKKEIDYLSFINGYRPIVGKPF